MTEPADNMIYAEESPRTWYIQVPNMIDDMRLTDKEVRLYLHLRRVAQNGGVCWQSTNTLARYLGWGKASVVKVKQALYDKGLIHIEHRHRDRGGRPYHAIKIVDIWDENHVWHSTKGEKAPEGFEIRSNPWKMHTDPNKPPPPHLSPIGDKSDETKVLDGNLDATKVLDGNLAPQAQGSDPEPCKVLTQNPKKNPLNNNPQQQEEEPLKRESQKQNDIGLQAPELDQLPILLQVGAYVDVTEAAQEAAEERREAVGWLHNWQRSIVRTGPRANPWAHLFARLDLLHRDGDVIHLRHPSGVMRPDVEALLPEITAGLTHWAKRPIEVVVHFPEPAGA